MKGKARKTLLVVGSLCTTILICVVFGFFAENNEDVIINRIVGIVAIISGLGSLLMGISSIFSTSLDNVREYYATGDTLEMSAARQVLYRYRYIKIKYGKSIFENDFDEWVQTPEIQGDSALAVANKAEILKAAGVTINFFQMWGLLQNKGFLPIWVFETASGYSILKLHQAVEDILAERRETNPFYGQQFTGLCQRILKKYKKAIRQCVESEEEYMAQVLSVEKSKVELWLRRKENGAGDFGGRVA